MENSAAINSHRPCSQEVNESGGPFVLQWKSYYNGGICYRKFPPSGNLIIYRKKYWGNSLRKQFSKYSRNNSSQWVSFSISTTGHNKIVLLLLLLASKFLILHHLKNIIFPGVYVIYCFFEFLQIQHSIIFYTVLQFLYSHSIDWIKLKAMWYPKYWQGIRVPTTEYSYLIDSNIPCWFNFFKENNCVKKPHFSLKYWLCFCFHSRRSIMNDCSITAKDVTQTHRFRLNKLTKRFQFCILMKLTIFKSKFPNSDQPLKFINFKYFQENSISHSILHRNSQQHSKVSILVDVTVTQTKPK